jgi:predicted kinase
VKTLHMMVGLPGSGKSTIAKGLGFPIVDPDAIRMAVHWSRWRVVGLSLLGTVGIAN